MEKLTLPIFLFSFSTLTFNGLSGDFLFPELFINATGGYLEPGTNPEDLSTSAHDPNKEASIQAVELHFDIDVSDKVTAAVYGAALQSNDEWEAALEEAFVHYQLNDTVTIGGGQFFSHFGWQSQRHLHQWDYVNQNLANSRLLNEGELVIQGGEMMIHTPNKHVVLTIGVGGVKTHSHDPGEEEEDHQFEAENANFNDWIVSSDLKFHLPGDESTILSASLAAGENGFAEKTWLYAVGIQKNLGDFMFQSEFMARDFDAVNEDGDVFQFNDQGISSSVFYQISDRSTLSFRHDWVSEIEALEFADHHRFSQALTTRAGEEERLQARIQYDYNRNDSLPGEHVAWLQFQWQWGADHEHEH